MRRFSHGVHARETSRSHSCGQIPQGDTSNLHGNSLLTAAAKGASGARECRAVVARNKLPSRTERNTERGSDR